jgi:DNA-directed RNA polymerase specialized sigma24 family protein
MTILELDEEAALRSPVTLGSSCLAAAHELIAAFGWRLLSETELAARAVATLAVQPELTPRQVCLNVYSRALYDACRDGRRQDQAYQELHYYLHRMACRRRADLADDAAQEAIELIFRQIHTCREPGAFLSFAWYKLLHAIRRLSPDHEEAELPTDDLFPWMPLDELLPAGEQAAIGGERVDDLWRCTRLIWQKQPRSHNQLRAVYWKYFDGLSDEEIAELLQTTVELVYVLRSRGLVKLRNCMAEQGYQVKGSTG